MKKIPLALFLLALVLSVWIGWYYNKANKDSVFVANDDEFINIKNTNMELISRAFKYGELIPTDYACDGKNVNPPLFISGIPEKSRSLALIMDDPDAPSGDWVHWTIWNIDPKTTEIPEGGDPAGAVEGYTSFGRWGYGGPCPPKGTHRYFFKLYALDVMLELPSSTEKAELEQAMRGHVLEQAVLMGLYER